MYPPPPIYRHRPPRPGVPTFIAVAMCLLCLVSGCVAGFVVGSAPAGDRSATAEPTHTRSVATSPTQTETHRKHAGRKPTKTAKAKPSPRRTKAAPGRTKAPSTDPRYRTCAEAKRHGLGPYRAGQTEYGWYQDRDHDGTVCE